MAAPFLLFFVMPSVNTTENKKQTPMPSVANERGININYMKELSAYFEDRFAFRTEMVDINSKIRTSVFNISPEDDVIAGNNGWLYYSATLDDYRGRDHSSDRSLYAMAKNISIIQKHVENEGAEFVFTIAPNKNSLYPENMPGQYKYIISPDHDAYRLKEHLDKLDVNYVNLFGLLAGKDEVLYMKTDSHWNKKGAVIGYNAMLDKASKEHCDYSDIKCELKPAVLKGDLSLMLYPVSTKAEEDYVYDRDYTYKYVYCSNETYSANAGKTGDTVPEDVTLNEIVTKSDNGDGSLLMYRDSFGNALIDLMAEEFETAYFTKQEPYDLSKAELVNADVVILEKVERHIKSLAKVAPLMAADELSEDEAATYSDVVKGKSEKSAKVEVTQENGFYKISGSIPADKISTDTNIYVALADGESVKYYEAFLINENEYCMYLSDMNDNTYIKVIADTDGDMSVMCDENDSNSDAVFTASFDKIEEMKAEELRLEQEALEKEERAKKEQAEKEKAEKEKAEKEEAERLEKEAEEQRKAEEKKTSGGKTVVSKVFYEDCGSDSGYYEIVWSDGSVTYEDVY